MKNVDIFNYKRVLKIKMYYSKSLKDFFIP